VKLSFCPATLSNSHKASSGVIYSANRKLNSSGMDLEGSDSGLIELLPRDLN
jgi:hypothetical protein